ncbi:nuclear transport factor 2 family protein [Streptomyces sp. NBC_01304]|uniref:nuclear transport factor 2 family protein n=1 Tax=Streptomyces sp. NBC_01304 TaxID=2903818 RepID=UPI002E12A18F|nr:nuclear transport factor 2 family protein [Streptomyces sp. NBC_01304]
MNTNPNTNLNANPNAHLAALSSPASDLDATVRELRDRAEITDALYRFGLGQDLKDKDLFASSFAADAELDFRPAAAKWGAQPPLMVGRDTIVTTILGLFDGRVDTTHQVTNVRITVDGDTARLTALVEAQHLLTADPSTYALLKNPYAVELVRDGDRWLIRHMRIDNTWFNGDPTAIFG